jgi:hypothetical protein
MLLTVYLKSNEITFEVKRPQKLPALESREKKRGGALGSAGGNGPADLAGNIAGGKWHLCSKFVYFIYMYLQEAKSQKVYQFLCLCVHWFRSLPFLGF